LFPYQSSDRCTEVNDITLLDSWVFSAQGHFTKNNNLFPIKFGKSFNGCPMKTVVRSSHLSLNAIHISNKLSNGSVARTVMGKDVNLLRVVLQQMNMTLVPLPTPKDFEMQIGLVQNVIRAMIAKEVYIALGDVGNHFLLEPYFDTTSTYNMFSVRWYVPCSVKYKRWSSIFRILSVELWIVLFISIVTATISTTLVGRYSFTSEWQGYKTLTSSLTNLWAVILRVSVSRVPRAQSLRSLFLAWLFFSLVFSTVLQAFLTTFFIVSGYKRPIHNMDELYASGMKLAYSPEYSFIFDIGDVTEVSKLKTNLVKCSENWDCVKWAKYHRNATILMSDVFAELNYASGAFVDENSEPLICRVEDGVVFSSGISMIMFHGDPLMRRVTEIIDRLVESGIYSQWDSPRNELLKLRSRKIGTVHPLDGYYSFNLYHMQLAFYLLLMGLCLSAFCFMIEVLYNCILSQKS